MPRIFCLLLLTILLSCTNKKKAVQEVMALKELNDLATVEYIVSKIIRTNDNSTWYKIGDRKILMSCRATLKAGIDFSQIREENIRIDEKQIEIILPQAKLISLNIRPEDIRVEYEEVGVFRQHFSAAEKDILMTQGENQIRNSAESLGLLRTAETNASVFVTNFLQQLGYTHIMVRFDKPDSLPTLN